MLNVNNFFVIYCKIFFCNLAERIHDVDMIRRRYPNRIPIIIERYHAEKHLPLLDRIKFLVPDFLTVAELVKIIRYTFKLYVFSYN